MTAIEIINQGHESYYNEVPRYKNPYEDSPGMCDNSILWFSGWDQANSVHDLFTRNQLLDAENKKLTEDKALLSSSRTSAVMELAELKHYVKNRSWFQFSREKVIDYLENVDKYIARSNPAIKVPD